MFLFRLSALTSCIPVDLISQAAADRKRRIMKTHLQLNLMPAEVLAEAKHKVLYVVRNPKDAAVSFYHHHKNIHGYVGTLEAFLEDFLIGELPFGSYFRHVEEFCRVAKRSNNFLLIRYEDILSDGCNVVVRVSRFLNVPMTDKDVQNTVDFLKFDNMKARKNSNMDTLTQVHIAQQESEFR